MKTHYFNQETQKYMERREAFRTTIKVIKYGIVFAFVYFALVFVTVQ